MRDFGGEPTPLLPVPLRPGFPTLILLQTSCAKSSISFQVMPYCLGAHRADVMHETIDVTPCLALRMQGALTMIRRFEGSTHIIVLFEGAFPTNLNDSVAIGSDSERSGSTSVCYYDV